jgi:hypothetical protein
LVAPELQARSKQTAAARADVRIGLMVTSTTGLSSLALASTDLARPRF